VTAVDPVLHGHAVEQLAARLGDLARPDVPLAPLTTYGVGGHAALLATVEDAAALARLAAATAGSPVPTLVVGLGSNLLVTDDGFAGLVVVLGPGFTDIEVEVEADHGTVRAGGRAKLPVVARRTAAAGLRGFEWASGVPGSVGGAVRMNAGVHEVDMAASLSRVGLVDLATGEAGERTAEQLDLGYRTSSVTPSQVVTWAELRLGRGDVAQAQATIKDKTLWRRQHQPGGRNAGSVFTNPPGHSAGRLIELAGCKGLRIGTAEVSPKHANFIQADEHGRAADVWELMAEVRRRIFAHAGVDLHPETCLVGLPPLPPISEPSGGEASP